MSERDPVELEDEDLPPEDEDEYLSDPPEGEDDETQEDDDHEEDDDLEDPPGEGAPPPRRKEAQRGNRQFGEMRRERRELRDQVQRLTGQLEVVQRSGFQQQTEQQRRDEADRIAAMTPEERVIHDQTKLRNDTAAGFAQIEFRSADRADKSDFRQLCRENSAYAAVAETVERELAAMHARGQRVDREVLANIEIGKRAAAKANEKGRKDREDKERKARRERSRPPRGGSDVVEDRGSERRGKGKTAADRLKNVTF